jgi:hypothetical protein
VIARGWDNDGCGRDIVGQVLGMHDIGERERLLVVASLLESFDVQVFFCVNVQERMTLGLVVMIWNGVATWKPLFVSNTKLRSIYLL